MDANYDRLLGYALRRVEQPADAADVACDVLLVAWRRIDDVPEGDDATLWLYGVARHAVANLRRGDRRRRALHAKLRSQVAALAVAGPEPSVADGVVEAMNALSADDRELLRLTAWEGLSPAEISTVLGVDAGTVRVRLHRARRRLEARLSTEGAGKRSAAGGQVVGGPATAGSRPKKAL